jgi:hypothetical protein
VVDSSLSLLYFKVASEIKYEGGDSLDGSSMHYGLFDGKLNLYSAAAGWRLLDLTSKFTHDTHFGMPTD